MAATGERVFVRKASGLIKTASNMDVLIFDIGLVSIGIGLGGLLLFGPSIYPGGSLPLAAVLGGVAMVFVGLGMICWTVTIPRSGGIYVFGTRSMWPPLAFTLSFVESSAWLFYSALGAFWITNIGIAPAVTTVGILNNNATLIRWGTDLNGKWATFLIGAACLIGGGVLLASGMRRFFLVQKIAFAIAVGGTVLFLLTLLFTSRESFVSNFNQHMGPQLGVGPDAYHGVIKATGYSDPGFDWKQTLLLANWAFLPLIGAAFSISIGGEIKQVSRGQTVGILGAVIGSVIVFIVSFALIYRTMGYTFLGAVTSGNLNGTKGASTPVTPWINLLVGVGAGSSILTVLISLAFVAWIWLWVPSQIGYGNRAIMAWALDRVAPDALGKVSDRTHTPVPAIAAATAAAVTFLAFYVFTKFFATVIFIEAGVVAWAIVLLAGVFFPYRRPDIYEKSPISATRVFGLPAMSVACALGSIACWAFFFDLFFDDFAAGHGRKALETVIGWFVAGMVIFFVMRQKRKSEGVDLDMAFKEIPVE
jgi:APA family basic amino acid/polyamine antiporter